MLDLNNPDLNKFRPRRPSYFYGHQEFILLLMAAFFQIVENAVISVLIWAFSEDFEWMFLVSFVVLCSYRLFIWIKDEIVFRLKEMRAAMAYVDCFESANFPTFFLVDNWFRALNDIEEFSMDPNLSEDVRNVARRVFVDIKSISSDIPRYLGALRTLQLGIAIHYERNADEFS